MKSCSGPRATATAVVRGVLFFRDYGTAGGIDTAFLFDSAGADTFIGTSSYSKLCRSGFMNRAKYFEKVYAHVDVGGYDQAYLYDSAPDDLFEAKPGWARMSSKNSHLSFLYEVFAFETATARRSTGNDTAIVAPGSDFLKLEGSWESDDPTSPATVVACRDRLSGRTCPQTARSGWERAPIRSRA